MSTPSTTFHAPGDEGPPSPMSVDDVDMEIPSNPCRPSSPSIEFPTFIIETKYDMNLHENKEPDYLQQGRERNRYRLTQQERKKALLSEAPKSLNELKETVSKTMLPVRYISEKLLFSSKQT